jgi:hypothetical protein
MKVNCIKRFLALVMTVALIFLAPTARSDVFGGDIAVLTQILAEAIKQLAELRNIVETGRDSLDLLRDINRGINDSLALIRTISPYIDPGQYGELKKVEDVLRKFSDIYGIVTESPNAKSQASVDRAVAEAVAMNGAIYDYTKQIDQIGEDIKSYSHSVSPGGAQKLTAESLGVILHVLTQSLRAQGTLLKLQAQSIAQTNKREKDYTAEYTNATGTLVGAMKSNDSQFERPRF